MMTSEEAMLDSVRRQRAERARHTAELNRARERFDEKRRRAQEAEWCKTEATKVVNPHSTAEIITKALRGG